MNRMLLLVLVALAGGAAVRAEDSGYSVEVGFVTFHGHKRKVEVPVTEQQGRRLQFAPREAQSVIEEAKRLYAEKLGFSRKVFGPDAWKIVPGLRVDFADLNLPNGASVELR